ncbi:MAG: C10 family peptidase [Planctomycetes bacterium]|nr:C10 family peptidase [Planctomycetota bacterium]
MRKRQTPDIILTGLICSLLFLRAADIWARPTTPQEAQLAVAGWLTGNTEPFDVPLGNRVGEVRTVTGEAGAPVYYIVHLVPSGFVIVPADDLVEPILSFTDAPTCEPSAWDPLTALVTADVNRRLADAYAAAVSGRLQIQSATSPQEKWGDLIGRAGSMPKELAILALPAVSEVRVAPFLKTRWAQGDLCSAPGYNYFTPNHNPAGCAAIAMAQLMYYYRYPAAGIGQRSFTITVLDKEQPAFTRGGDGAGGPYQWDQMVPVPDCTITAAQRQAIAALCYDAGVAVRMSYAPDGSGSDALAITAALKNTFAFRNGISGTNNGRNVGTGLADMINPNLDAEYPVILGILGQTGHGVVVDGYGYDASTRVKALYHHLNMGWGGHEDIWYNLPAIGNYDTIPVCIYNIFPEGTGEIISGRVTDAFGQPIWGATVRADLRTKRYEAITNKKGIYALTQLASGALFTVQANLSGLTFTKQSVETGTSRDREASAGNRWGIDFVGAPATGSLLAAAYPSESEQAEPSTPAN